MTNNRVSSSPKASIFPLLLEAWTAARKAFQGCFLEPIHSETSQRLSSLLAHWAFPRSPRSPGQPRLNTWPRSLPPQSLSPPSNFLGNLGVKPHTHHSSSLAVTASSVSPGPTAPPALWPSSSLGTAVHLHRRPPHWKSAPFSENLPSFCGGPCTPPPQPPLSPLQTVPPPRSTSSWGAGAAPQGSDPSRPPQHSELPAQQLQLPRILTQTLTSSRVARGQAHWEAPAPGRSLGRERQRCSPRPRAAAVSSPGLAPSSSSRSHGPRGVCLRTYAWTCAGGPLGPRAGLCGQGPGGRQAEAEPGHL